MAFARLLGLHKMNLPHDTFTKHQRLIAIVAVALILRVAVAFLEGNSVEIGKDEASYSILAGRLASGFGYTFPTAWYPFTPADTPTSHWSFLYTGAVSALYRLFGETPLVARLVSAVFCAVAHPIVTFHLAMQLGLPRRTAEVAAGIAAVYGYFVLFAAKIQTEALFIIAVLWVLERGLVVGGAERFEWRKVISFGLSLGVAALLRQSILPWLVVLFGLLLWHGWRFGRIRTIFPTLFASGLILLAFILPFTWRNYQAYGTVLLLNSNSGYALYSAQHPLHGTDFQEYTAAPLPTEFEPFALNEAEWEQELTRRGIEFIQAEPDRYLRLSLSRFFDYIKFWPTASSTLLFNAGRLFSFTLFLPFMLYGLRISWRDRKQYTILYAFIVTYSLLHIFTWAMPRYRLPVDGCIDSVCRNRPCAIGSIC